MIVAGCEEEVTFDNEAPTGLSIETSRCLFWTDAQTTLIGTAVDPDGDPLSYRWSVTGGSLSPPDGRGAQVLWTAPDEPGAVRITLTATDRIVEKAVSILVNVHEIFPSLLAGSLVIENIGSPYVLLNDQPITIGRGVTVTIEAGVEIVVAYTTGGINILGTLNVWGTENSNVTIKPNTCSNPNQRWRGLFFSGDVITHTKAYGNLEHFNILFPNEGVQINAMSEVVMDSCTVVGNLNTAGISISDKSFVTLTNCRIRENERGIYVQNSDVTISGCDISYNYGHGILMSATEEFDMSIQNCIISNNSEGIRLQGIASPAINWNSIFLNEAYGFEEIAIILQNYDGTDSIDAENNFYGLGHATEQSISGLMHDKEDDPATINAYIDFVPFLVEEPVVGQGRR